MKISNRSLSKVNPIIVQQKLFTYKLCQHKTQSEKLFYTNTCHHWPSEQEFAYHHKVIYERTKFVNTIAVWWKWGEIDKKQFLKHILLEAVAMRKISNCIDKSLFMLEGKNIYSRNVMPDTILKSTKLCRVGWTKGKPTTWVFVFNGSITLRRFLYTVHFFGHKATICKTNKL